MKKNHKICLFSIIALGCLQIEALSMEPLEVAAKHPTIQSSEDQGIRNAIRKSIQSHVAQEDTIHKKPICVDALFLGPHGENAQMFMDFIHDVLNDHLYWRRSFHPEDPFRITEKIQRSDEFLEAKDRLRKHLRLLLAELKNYSNPLFSFRYQAHMYWEMTIPSLVGYIATILYNPNNVAFEGAPVTTCLEEQAAEDLCRMIGYSIKEEKQENTSRSADSISTDEESESESIVPWGHLTGGGTIANIEALWAARNLKFFPFSIKQALENEGYLEPAREITVKLPHEEKARRLLGIDTWDLLNIPADEALQLPERIFRILQINNIKLSFTKLYKLLVKNSVQEKGLLEVYQSLNTQKDTQGQPILTPVVLVTATKHYSFPKAVSLLGLGKSSLIDVIVDKDAHMNIKDLEEKLDTCTKARRPVIAVVGIIGSTEESAVDPVDEILNIRDSYRSKGLKVQKQDSEETELRGLDFYVHADAAWGGYFASLRKPQSVVPTLGLSDYVNNQMKVLKNVDSVTIDPHKSGYMPYPAGALCYSNQSVKNMVNFTAPYLSTEGRDQEPILGIYGVEGSKPGASAAMVYLTHRVIPLNENGYGVLLGQSLYSAKIFYLELLNMNRNANNNFTVVPLTECDLSEEIIKEILEAINKKKPEDKLEKKLLTTLNNIGPDLNIIAYSFNYKVNGKVNPSLEKANDFNTKIFNKLRPQLKKPATKLDLIVSNTSLESSTYGKNILESFAARLKVKLPTTGEYSINMLRSVMMNPWVTETEEGPFLPTIIEELTKTVNSVLKDEQNGFLEPF